MRFSLLALLAVVMAASVLCGLLFSVPDQIALLVFLVISLHLPTGMVLGIVYFDRDVRAFCIGGAAALGNIMLLNMFYSSSMVLEEVSGLLLGVSADAVEGGVFGKLMFVYLLGACLTGGLLGLAARRVSTRHPGNAPSVTPPIPDDMGST